MLGNYPNMFDIFLIIKIFCSFNNDEYVNTRMDLRWENYVITYYFMVTPHDI